jgi:hypothetical protein
MLSCRALSCWFCWTGSEQNSAELHAPWLHWPVVYRSLSPFPTQHVSLNNVHHLQRDVSFGCSPTRWFTKCLYCNRRYLFGIGYWNTHFTETPFATTAMLAPLVARYGNSTNPLSVRDHHPSEYVLCTFLCYSVCEQYYVQIVCILCVQTALFFGCYLGCVQNFGW